MSNARSMRWGDDEVAVEVRAWRSMRFNGYRKTYLLRPGERWADAEVSADQYEHLVDLDGEAVPVGVVIARELVDSGADWAFCTELWGSGGPVLLGPDGVCVPVVGEVADLIATVREINGGRLGGLPDVIGRQGDKVLVREAKLGRGRDALRANQHDLLRALRGRFGDKLDAKVVEWYVSDG